MSDPRNKFQKDLQEKTGNSTMNNGSGSKNRFMIGLHLKGQKERDSEDLHLFRELHKRDKERTTCLLLPVDDLEHNNGNFPFYRIQSIRKEFGFELLSEGNKNDYDWLKTPPATPLFPSLEMEATAPHMKETPLVRHLSQPKSQLQVSSNSEATKRSNEIEKSPTTKPKIPSRFITPSYRPRINSSIEPKNTKRTTTPSPRITQATSTDPTIKRNNNNNMKSINLKESCTDYLTSNLSKGSANVAKPKPNSNPNPNPRSRTTSPIVRSTIASQIPEFSNETPPNLRTDRSSSVTRGRQIGIGQKSEAIDSRRQSCSLSVTRGRKVEAKQEKKNRGGNSSNDQRRSESTNILGSQLVEKVMNARKGNVNEEKDLKARGGIGIEDLRFMSKTSATHKTLKQMVCEK